MLIQKSLERVRENKLANDMYSLLVRLGMERFLIKIVYKWYELKPTYKMQQSSMYFNKHKEEIRELGKLLADQQSKNVWLKMIKLRMTMDYRYHPSKDRPQYFAKDLIQYDKNEVFIDCGAYDGKTSAEFMKYALNSGGGIKESLFFCQINLTLKRGKKK